MSPANPITCAIAQNMNIVLSLRPGVGIVSRALDTLRSISDEVLIFDLLRDQLTACRVNPALRCVPARESSWIAWFCKCQ